jgi:hypothetical protein
MNLKEIKDAARKAFRDQQLQDTEGGVPDVVSFCAGFLSGFRHIESAFNDRCKVIEIQLEDKKKLEEENKKLRKALEFYADPRWWDYMKDDLEEVIFDSGFKCKEKGRRAREALKE